VEQLWHNLVHRHSRLLLAAIFLIGAAFRLYHLATFSIWRDEAQTVFLARHAFPSGIVQALLRADVSPPLYYFILHFWDQVLGSDWWLRFLSVAFGLAAIPLLHWVGERLFDRDVALLAALAGALSPHHIVVSRTVRMYTILPLISLLALYFTHRFTTQPADAKRSFLRDGSWWGLVLTFALVLYTHNVGAFLVLSANAFIAAEIVWRKEARRLLWPWVAAQLCVALLYSPWVPALIQQLRSQGAVMGPWLPRQSRLGNMLRLFNELTGLAWPGERPWLWMAICLLGALTIKIRRPLVAFYFRLQPALNLILLCFVGPIVFAAVLTSPAIGMIPSYVTLVAFPAMCYLIARGVHSVRPRALSLLLLIGLAVIWVQTVSVTYVRRTSNLREIAFYVSARIQQEDAIVVAPDYLASSFNYYFEGPQEQVAFPSTFGRVEDITWVGWAEAWQNAAQAVEPTLQHLQRTIGGKGRVWLIAPLEAYPDDPYFSQIRELKAALDGAYGSPQIIDTFPPAVEYAALYIYR
jgi:mannosyltransferase